MKKEEFEKLSFWEKYKKQWTENKWTLFLIIGAPLILLIYFSINPTVF